MNEMKKLIGQRLKSAREQKNLKQNSIARKLGIHNSTLAKYESGEREPDNETLLKLCELYDVNLEWILTGNPLEIQNQITPEQLDNFGEIKYENGVIKIYLSNLKETFVHINILGNIRNGVDLFKESQVIGAALVPIKDVSDGEYFYFSVTGNTMIDDGIHPGIEVLVRRQDHIDEGKIGVVLVQESEASIYRVNYQKNLIVLVPSNTAIRPIVLPMDEVQIIGQVTKVIRNV